jgi:hypothetical protein
LSQTDGILAYMCACLPLCIFDTFRNIGAICVVRSSIHPSVSCYLSLRVLRACTACDIYVIFSLDSTPAVHDSRSSFSDREKQRRHRRPFFPALTLRYLDLQSPFVPHAQTTEHYLKPCDATCNRIVVVYQGNFMSNLAAERCEKKVWN